ncbi:MAG: hypothetical protein HYZ14_07090 [Bacteroidetes bacterium]|nr:hypothetical protein [Bacteroidota bacterium]
MKTILQGITFLFALTAISCSNKNIHHLEWRQTKSGITSIPKYYDNVAKTAYDITNDSLNLYLSIVVADENTRLQVMMSGIEVWIDTTKKASKNFGLLFPLKMQPGAGMKMERPNPDQPPKIDDMQKQYLTNQTQFKSIGLNGFKEGLNSTVNNLGLNLSLDFDSTGSFIYRAIIPLACLHIYSFDAVDSTDIFTITLIIPGMELPEIPGGGPEMGGPGGMPGGPPPGGMGGPGGPPDMAGTLEDKVIRFRFTLNKK